MNRETRSQSKNRKRIRPEIFDANRSTYLIDQKRTKTNSNMTEPTGNDQIRDLSQTILTRSTSLTTLGPVILQGSSNRQDPLEKSTQSANIMSHSDVALAPGPLTNDLHMVKNDIVDIRKAIGELTQVVKELANRAGPNRASDGLGVSENCEVTTEPPRRNEDGQTFMRHNSQPKPSSSNVHTFRPEIHHDNNLRIRVDKLGLIFDGNSPNMDVEDFLFRLEHLQTQYCIPWSEIVRDFHLLMSGAAWKWYWLFLNENRNCEWPNLRHALISRFQSRRSNFEIMRDLVERKQQNNESIDTFFHDMCQIRSKLIPPINDYEMIKIMKKNVRDHIARIVYAMPVSSVEQLRIECNEAERNFPRREHRLMPPPSRPSRQINEVYMDETESISEVECDHPGAEEVCEVQINRPRLTCWNCHKPGHTFMECDSTERALFCYRCGHPNTITPKCPNCQSGNRSRGVEKLGGPRPNETPALN